MEYTTIQKTADRWGISKARVHLLCQEGRIPGAVYENRHWRVPVDAEKPKAGKPGFLSASEMARKWGMDGQKVIWMCQEGLLPDVERGGKTWLIPQDMVNPLEGYVLVSEMAQRWSMSRVAVSKFCKDGRIPGVKRFGSYWYIPVDAKKPADERTERNTGYISPTKAAEKWDITRQHVCRACREGLIPGAELIDGRWHVPEDATKPARKRTERKPSYLSATGAAEKWGTSPMFVRKAARNGCIPGAKKNNGSGWKIPEDAVYPGTDGTRRK